MLKRGLWLVVLITVLVTGAAIALSERQQALYRASADVFLGSEDLSADLTGTISRDPERELSTQARLARLPVVASRAIVLAREQRRPYLLRNSSVTSTGDADILTFSVTAPGEELAARLASAYAKAYTQYRKQIDTQALVEARHRVEDQLAKLRASGVDPRSSLYITLEQRRGQIQTVETLRGSKALLVRPAEGGIQTQPKTKRNAIFAGFLGLLLGIALVLMRDALNTRVQRVEEVQPRLGLPLLARVPDFDDRRREPGDLTMLTSPRSAEAEAFRILATNIEFANADVGARTIMVTSSNRSEGKSTVLANLAVAFARRGKRVVLADLDLRRPSVATLFGIDQRPGVSDVARGGVPLEQALTQLVSTEEDEAIENASNGARRVFEQNTQPGILEVLPAGTLPHDAGELVGSENVSRLIAQLEERADIVLIDAPPILQVGDTLALTARVDALIAVTRLSRVKKPVLDELRRVLDTAPIVQLGMVATGVAQDAAYGYAYYGYGYGAAASSGKPDFVTRGPVAGRRSRARDHVQ